MRNTNHSVVKTKYQTILDKTKQTKIINIFGGPSIGKSSVASGLFYELKKRHIPVDVPYEFPKVLAWDKNYPAIKDQFYVIANQHRGISRSWGEVDYIIVDSPLLLAPVYKSFYSDQPYYPSTFYGKEFDDFIFSLHKKYDNLNIVLKRDESRFEDTGRYQDLDNSKKLDILIKTLLVENDISYTEVKTEDAVDKILGLLQIQ